jgi:hypothetical protein
MRVNLRRRVTRAFWLVAVIALAGLTAVQGDIAVPAMAAEAQTVLVTDVASTLAPRVPGGQCYPGVPDPTACRYVLTMIRLGGWIYAGGIISDVFDPNTGVTTSGFSNVFRFDAVTQRLDTTFQPQFYRTAGRVDDARVTGLAASADGSQLYVAGRFTTVASSGTVTAYARRGLAMIDTLTGAVNTGFNARICQGGGPCNAFDVKLVANQSLWVGGDFTFVQKVPRTAFASLDPITGALTSNVSLAVSGTPVTTVGTKVTKIALSPNSTRAVIIGNFAAVAGSPRNEVAVMNVDTSTGSTLSVNTWNAPTYLNGSVSGCSKADTWPRAVDWDPTGTYFDIAASGSGGFNPWPALCDSLSRWQLDSMGNGNPNSTPIGYNETEVDSMFSVCDVGPLVYVGGHFKSLNHEVRVNGIIVKPAPGQVNETHYGLGVITADTTSHNNMFAVTAWNHTSSTGRGAGWAAALCLAGTGSTGGGVYFGGDAEEVNGNPAIERLAYFPAAG